MGLRFRKSIRIAPGLNINLSASSSGITLSGRGFSHTINSRGYSNTSLSIPGTGLSYNTSGNSKRKKSKANLYSRGEELRNLKQNNIAMADYEKNKIEVELFQNKIDKIKSIHKEVDAATNWNHIATLVPNFNPSLGEKGINELKAIEEMDSYVPSFMDKMSNQACKKVDKLNQKILNAKKRDIEEYNYGISMVNLAKNILNGNTDSYLEAIAMFNPLDDLLEFGSEFEFFAENSELMEVDFEVNSESAVPTEKLSLSNKGELIETTMSKAEYFNIQQDYICSVAIRIVRDLFALLPLNSIVINALETDINSATGIEEKKILLSVKIDRNILNTLNMDLIDPSDSMSNFQCNMNFKKKQGMLGVERLLN